MIGNHKCYPVLNRAEGAYVKLDSRLRGRERREKGGQAIAPLNDPIIPRKAILELTLEPMPLVP